MSRAAVEGVWSDGGGGQCDVVGYEVESSEALGTKGTKCSSRFRTLSPSPAII